MKNGLHFTIDEKIAPSEVIKRLMSTLSIRNLEFITNKKLKKNNSVKSKFQVRSVTMVGSVDFVKLNLQDYIKELVEYFEKYIGSIESNEDKIYELSMAKLYISEYFLKNNLDNPEFLESKQSFILNIPNEEQTLNVIFEDCDFTNSAIEELSRHQNVRYEYISLLDKYIALWLSKVIMQPLVAKRLDSVEDNVLKIQLLEVWIALKLAGFISATPNDETIIRKDFFKLFNLTDNNYNSRNQSIKDRKPSFKAIFLETLVEKINNYPTEKP